MDDRFDNRRYHTQDTFRVTSTAGAVQIKNEKGEVSLQKVKVERYISGKRPAYAKKEFELDVSENESEDNDFISHRDRPDIKHEHSGRQIDIPESIELDEDNLQNVNAASDNDNDIENNISNDNNPNNIKELDDPRLKRLFAVKKESKIGYGDVENENKRKLHESETIEDNQENDVK